MRHLALLILWGVMVFVMPAKAQTSAETLKLRCSDLVSIAAEEISLEHLLREAQGPLMYPDLKKAKAFIQEVKARPSFVDCGLTEAELHTLAAYTANSYRFVNTYLREQTLKNTLPDVEILVRLMLSGLNKLADYEGLVLRKVSLPKEISEQYVVGNIVSDAGFVSTGINYSYFGELQLEILSKTCKYIAPISYVEQEAEVLCLPGTQFKVLSRNGNKILLQEIAASPFYAATTQIQLTGAKALEIFSSELSKPKPFSDFSKTPKMQCASSSSQESSLSLESVLQKISVIFGKERKADEERLSIDPIKERKNFVECGLSEAEIMLMTYYTGSFSGPVNDYLRGTRVYPEQVKEGFKVVVEVMQSALNKLRDYKGLVKRGTTLPENVLSQYVVGNIVSDPAFLSTGVGFSFVAEVLEFYILSKTCKYIAPLSALEREKEVLCLPGTKFKVLAREGNHFLLEEL